MTAQGGMGLALAACAECGCAAGDYHDPGCSHAPHVCPGCHAVDEDCLPGCIDREFEAEYREAIESGDYEPLDLNDCADWEFAP